MRKAFIVCLVLGMMTMLGCKKETNMYGLSASYDINYYVDTISGHLILTTVCNYTDNTGLSTCTISLGMVDTSEK